jgi:hypothetical protein
VQVEIEPCRIESLRKWKRAKEHGQGPERRPAIETVSIAASLLKKDFLESSRLPIASGSRTSEECHAPISDDVDKSKKINSPFSFMICYLHQFGRLASIPLQIWIWDVFDISICAFFLGIAIFAGLSQARESWQIIFDTIFRFRKSHCPVMIFWHAKPRGLRLSLPRCGSLIRANSKCLLELRC